MKPSPSWLSALAGLITGAGVIGLLPAHSLFQYAGGAQVGAVADGGRWACPMMDFVGTKPGRCPVCGMTLVRVVAGELNAEQVRRSGIETTRVSEGPATATVRAYGIVEYDPRQVREVTTRVSGRVVVSHPATQGLVRDVQVGEPLLDLFSNDLISAQGELLAARRLGDEALTEQVQSRFARWGLGDLAAAVLTDGRIRDTVTLHSPFEGRILPMTAGMPSAPLVEGKELMAGEPILRLVDQDRLLIVAHVPEARAHWVIPGQRVRLSSDDFGTLTAPEAHIDQVAPELSPLTRTREIRIAVTNLSGTLLPGALVAVSIDATLDSMLRPIGPEQPNSATRFPLLPKTAVLSTGTRHLAWKVAERKADGTVRFTPALLELGPRLESADGNDLFVIRSGLVAGDEVVTQGAFLVDSQAQLAGAPSLLSSHSSVSGTATHAH
jgi:membrane fusion protein, copper/silver efflux system